MKRHFQRLSLDVIIKRGFSIISALILSVGLVFTPVHAEDINATQPALKISWLYFRSNTQTNNTGGNTTDQAWLIYNFEFDKPYTGTMQSIITYTAGFGYVPYMMGDGVYYTVQTEVTEQTSSYTTRKNTFDFVLTNTRSFKVIITIANTYLNYGGVTTPSMNLTAADGSSASGIDYTNILTDMLGYQEDITIDLETLINDVSAIGLTDTQIYNTLVGIQGSLQGIYKYLNMKYYTKSFYSALLSSGYTTDYSAFLSSIEGYSVKAPSTFSGRYSFTHVKGENYIVVFTTNNNGTSNINLTRSSGAVIDLNSRTIKSITGGYGTLKTFTFTESLGGTYKITKFTNADYIVPIYYGTVSSMPEEVRVMLGYDSTPTLIEKIIALFQENNSQNDQMIDQLDDINHDTGTISQQIDNLNTDFNNALSDVPINETLQEINNLNSAFQTVNGWWAQLWNALGVIKIIIILAMILMLIRIFLGRSR